MLDKLNLALHHIGVACLNLEKERELFLTLGFEKEAEFIDKTQGVKGEFVVTKNSNFPFYRFELLENLHSNGPLSTYLKNRTKMYHLAFESKNIEQDLNNLQTGGGDLRCRAYDSKLLYATLFCNVIKRTFSRTCGALI